MQKITLFFLSVMAWACGQPPTSPLLLQDTTARQQNNDNDTLIGLMPISGFSYDSTAYADVDMLLAHGDSSSFEIEDWGTEKLYAVLDEYKRFSEQHGVVVNPFCDANKLRFFTATDNLPFSVEVSVAYHKKEQKNYKNVVVYGKKQGYMIVHFGYAPKEK